MTSVSGSQGSQTEAELVEREMGLSIEYVKSYERELDYRNKLVLAPMVRTGSCKWDTLTFTVMSGLIRRSADGEDQKTVRKLHRTDKDSVCCHCIMGLVSSGHLRWWIELS